MRTFILFLAALLTFQAQAQSCTKYQTSYSNGPHSSAAAACQASMSQWLTPIPGGSWSFVSASNGQCKYRNAYTFNEQQYVQESTLDYNEFPGDCQPEGCQAQKDQTKIVNWTTGYTRSANIDTDPNWSAVSVNPVPPSRLACDPSQPCQIELGTTPRGNYQSESPTPTGLYRLSTDYLATFTGESCTISATDSAGLSPDAQIPECPGFVGEVNGKLGCYGTAANPTRNDKPLAKPGPAVAGNPRAGPKPESGEGSGTGGAGRTPSTGNGGPAGGPAAAAGPNNTTPPDGTTDKPDEGKEQLECGAPGQPKCAIDERGTPTGDTQVDGLGGLKDGIKAFGEKSAQDIDEAKGLSIDGWSFTFALPTGCTPLVIEPLQVTLDVCQWQGIIHDLLSMVWLAVTVWCCVGMVGRTLQT